jgi:PKD repeat protein
MKLLHIKRNASFKVLYVVMVLMTISLLIPTLALAQNSPPVADAGPQQTIYLGDSVTLHGTATDPDNDPIVGWQWEVVSAPAGSTYSLLDADTPDALFTTDTLGDYVITLIASDGLAWSDPAFTAVTVVENQPPTAAASATPLSGPAPLTVDFDGTGSSDPEGGALLYDWDFGDSSSGTGETTSHEYLYPGSYVARLMVTDERGAIDFDTVDITVTPPNNPPVANPKATPNSGLAPLVVAFAANASDPDGDPLTYLWNFGDPASSDNESTLPDPQHVYEAPDTYTAWLTVSDGKDEVSVSVPVVVSAGQPLSTRRASVIKWFLGKSEKGTISYWADIDLPMPAPDDVISFTFDGVKVFTQPFSAFKRGLRPNVYVLVKRWLLVRINFATHRIYVLQQKANIKNFDNSDGVDVELMWGDQVAVDQFMMTQVNKYLWNYDRDE